MRLKVIKIIASNNVQSITTLKLDEINESEMNAHDLSSQFLKKRIRIKLGHDGLGGLQQRVGFHKPGSCCCQISI